MTARKTRAKSPARKNTPKAKAPEPGQKRTRAVAEARGLAQRDAVIASKPSEPNARGSLAETSFIDQPFRVWAAMMRMSPLPFVLQQQAMVAKLIMGFLLPTTRPGDAGEDE
jgi:hypothetical protein